MTPSEPVATPDDLRVVLDADSDSFDTDRAALILRLAQDLCETIVNPLPIAARGVVVGVAMRAFVNPQQAHDIRLGSAGIGFGASGGAGAGIIGGLYLSRADKATLRRMNGQGGAYSIDMLPTGINEVQLVTVIATAGTFTLAFNGTPTAPIGFAPTASQILAALVAIPSLVGNVAVTGSGPFRVEFIGSLATTPLPALVASGTALTGTATVSETTRGVFAPGQNLPYWDRDYLTWN